MPAIQVDVDFSAPVSVKSQSGMIHGMNILGKNSPPDSRIKPLHLKIHRSSNINRDYTRAISFGAQYMLVLSDVYGYSGKPRPYEDNYVQWEATCATIANLGLGKNILYDIWNEPDLTQSWKGTQVQLFETYRRGFLKIRSIDSTAKIGGPSLANYDGNYIKNFLDYCLSNSLECNFVSWHELSSVFSDIRANLAYIRANFVDNAQYAALNIEKIYINEIVGPDPQYNPAAVIKLLMDAEIGGSDGACKSCWNRLDGIPANNNCSNDTLNGLLLPEAAARPTGGWWGWKAYGENTTGRVASTSSESEGTHNLITYFAAKNNSNSQHQIVVGYSKHYQATNYEIFNNPIDYYHSQAVKVTADKVSSLGLTSTSKALLVIETINNTEEGLLEGLNRIEKAVDIIDDKIQVALSLDLHSVKIITIKSYKEAATSTINTPIIYSKNSSALGIPMLYLGNRETLNVQSAISDIEENLVDVTSDQIISGVKIFSGEINVIDKELARNNLGASPNVNYAVNPRFNVWTKGTNFIYPAATGSLATTETANEWLYLHNPGTGNISPNVTISRQTFVQGQTEIPNNPAYFLRIEYDAGWAATGSFSILRNTLGNVTAFAGQTVTVSLWARSSVAGARRFPIAIQQNFGTGGTPSAQSGSSTSFFINTNWTKYKATLKVPSIANKSIGNNGLSTTKTYLEIGSFSAVGSFPQAGNFDIAEVKVELGSTASSLHPQLPDREEIIEGNLTAGGRLRALGAVNSSVVGFSRVDAGLEGAEKNPKLVLENSNNLWSVDCSNNGTLRWANLASEKLTVSAAGNLGIGLTVGSVAIAKFQVSGGAVITDIGTAVTNPGAGSLFVSNSITTRNIIATSNAIGGATIKLETTGIPTAGSTNWGCSLELSRAGAANNWIIAQEPGYTDALSIGLRNSPFTRHILFGLDGKVGFGTTSPGCYQFSGRGVAVSSGTSAVADPGAGNLTVTGRTTTGGLKVGARIVTANTTITTAGCLLFINAANNAIDLTLPTAIGNLGTLFILVRTDNSANVVRVLTSPNTQTINGSASFTIPVNASFNFSSNDVNWFAF